MAGVPSTEWGWVPESWESRPLGFFSVFLVCRTEIKQGWGMGQETKEMEQEGTLAPLGTGRWGHYPFCILTLS